MSGNNAPIMVKGGNVYDSPLGYDAPIEYDTARVSMEGVGVDWSLKKCRQEIIRRLGFVVEPVKVQRTFDQLRKTVAAALGFSHAGTPVPRTMESLRNDLLRRLGFSAQATAGSWPPGMKELLTNFLYEAQVALQHQYRLGVDIPLGPFSADNDVTTLDPWAVFLLALANAKAHHAQPDSKVYYDQLGGYIATVAKSSDVDQIINTAQDSLLQRYAMDRYTDGTAPLVNGSDKTLIDGVAVEMQAIADAKAKYGQKDAEAYYGRLQEMAQRRPFDLDAMVDSFIRDAQDQLYQQYKELRTERWWTVECVPGANLYDVPLDLDQYLDFRRITWAGILDGGQWTPLIEGIDPVLYTSTSLSKPAYYRLTGVIEIFPAPDRAYTIKIRGHLGLKWLNGDDDLLTVNSRAVFLHALANAKAHYRQPDAGNYMQQAQAYVRQLVSGAHGTRRYIPGTRQIPPARRPVPVGGWPES
ncbi:hypothetical protein [[Pseudomonas] boreopolis]|uniref:Uncharacterized protein n=1 Tax=Xanthomonas boreopolis TaxID=86183 RepID=A0A919F9J5_9XANT|nr:hypothetical protein GCM10009090_25190 [[Pseudomonas] boreopolis]